MKALRNKRKLTLSQMGDRMKPSLSSAYLCDLERGNRHWNNRLISEYRRVCG